MLFHEFGPIHAQTVLLNMSIIPNHYLNAVVAIGIDGSNILSKKMTADRSILCI